ncbi:SurA N-terminal domain-containing protein [Aceticella autotrophica]|uniref:SurA N-terminal domain-containing protein n=1 Tax=Aceticella autotrophica TaxID=2755338 RepID=A0A974Y2R8_9THEO|nr:SurA N-terminal domain-containing protein [Aceticella autotrophica]QSZ26466.1 SurA N-terminal domain-containing protein [Aceticella autotrophica]
MFRKKYYFIFVIFAIVLSLFMLKYCFIKVKAQTNQMINYINKDGSKYPKIVAKVGSLEINNKEFATEVFLIKNKYQNKNENFYEKEALKNLILNKEYELEELKHGLFVTDDEVDAYLKNMENVYNTMNDKNGDMTKFIQDVKNDGFNNIQNFFKNQQIRDTYKKALLRVKLRNYIMNLVDSPTDNDINNFIKDNNLDFSKTDKNMLKQQLLFKKRIEAWDAYNEQLLKSNNFSIYIPININK